MKTPPKTAKGTMREIEVACAAWVDLLGYGSMLEAAGFDLTNAMALDAMSRLAEFQKIVAKHSCRYFPTFVMNDGAVAYRDLSPRSPEVTFDFLRRSYDLFLSINKRDKDDCGFPGARMVIATGFRLRRPLDFNSFLTGGKAKSIKARLKDGVISQEQALNEALKTRNTHDTNPELQGNFALTKAYLADSTGTAGGLGGPNCFIDLALFDDPPPEWLHCAKRIEWSSRGLTATFAEIVALDGQTAAASKYQGIRDAFAVSRNLSNSSDIEHQLKSRRVTRHARRPLTTP